MQFDFIQSLLCIAVHPLVFRRAVIILVLVIVLGLVWELLPVLLPALLPGLPTLVM